MAIGPQDYIDQMLAKKYSAEKVNNVIEDVSRLTITKERYWEIQKDIAEVQRALVMVSTKMRVGGNLKQATSPA
ncbi:MAG: hypothetical protein A2039_09340 [Candidatus Melainabacteria bacterium GWA2_34_9]|nr:MAG: hypothetical protein A2039_09340 [Candidatus Melainabacteria bacterium GWA2_34_9]